MKNPFRRIFTKMADHTTALPDDNLTAAAAHAAGEMADFEAAPHAAETPVAVAAAEPAFEPNTETGPAAELADLKDKYLRLAAEFENYKRRTTKERIELFKTANQELMTALLPVLDDFDRARQHTEGTDDTEALRHALDITYNKLTKTLQQKGLAAMETKGGDFDADLHEAITQIPAPTEEMKGKVVDEVERGYYLGDKVVRHAKVVLGA